ncbi:hypothetical protein ABKN59_003970 [Abortiporus biennis]
MTEKVVEDAKDPISDLASTIMFPGDTTISVSSESSPSSIDPSSPSPSPSPPPKLPQIIPVSSSSSLSSEAENSLDEPSASSISISVTSSANTSTSTIPSILRTSSTHTLTTRSMPPSAVKFAPLPPTEPRRRNSNVQLGIAARSQMLRNRRMITNGEGAPTVQYIRRGNEVIVLTSVSSGVWGEEGETTYVPQDPGLAEDAVEDAFIALGKFVKDASKSLWRKVSHKDKKEKGKSGEGDHSEKDGTPTLVKKASSLNEKPKGILKESRSPDENGVAVSRDSGSRSDSGGESEKGKEVRARIKSIEGPTIHHPEEEEGGVWEEEISEDLKRNSTTTTTTSVQSTVISITTSKVEVGGGGSTSSKPKSPTPLRHARSAPNAAVPTMITS